MLVVGNGGIATELVHELMGIEVVWAVRDDSVSAAFVDAGAGQFFLDQIAEARKREEEQGGGQVQGCFLSFRC